MSDKDLVYYVLVNEDLSMSRGKTASQVAHALTVFMYNNITHKADGHALVPCFKHDIEEWINIAQKKIILKCPQIVLETLEKRSTRYIKNDIGIDVLPIRDKGLTEIAPNSLTCVGIGLIDRNNFPEEFAFIKELRLLQ